MADYYLDHGAYPAYAATPTWPAGGTPSAQDGDGKATGLAASAQASIEFNGITASAGHTVVVAGATLTCVASGATANQFNAGSGATLATNVAAAINAATGTVAANASVFTPQLRDFAYARATGTKVEIMTRAGSADFNQATNSFMVITTAGMTAPTIVQFYGGASGAWGYLWNRTAMLPSAKAVGAYGVGMANETTAGRLLAGALPTDADIVWKRANDRDYNPAATVTVNLYQPLNIVVDASNVKWPDTAGKAFKIRNTGVGASMSIYLRGSAPSTGSYSALLAATVYGALGIYNESTTSSANAPVTVSNGNAANIAIHFENVEFADLSASSQLSLQNQYQAANNKSWMFRNCKFRWARSNAVYGMLSTAGTLTGATSMVWDGCAFVFDGLSQVHPGIVNAFAVASSISSFRLANCSCSAASDVAAFVRFSASTYTVNCTADNLTGFRLPFATQMGLYSMLSAAPYAGAQDGAYVLHQNIGPKKGFRLETPCVVLDWIPDSNYPGLRSYLPDGTLWSWRTVWSSAANHYSGTQPIEVVTLNKQAPATDGVRTVTAELLMDPACLSGATNKVLELAVAYTNTSGAQVVETTCPALAFLAAESPVAASAAAWDTGGFPAFVAGKLALTTSQAVKGGTDIAASIRLRGPSPSGSTSSLFIDPEVDIA